MSYWDVLAEAAARLENDDLAGAEAAFSEALRQRERSPGQVFLSERLADAARRLWTRARRRPLAAEIAAGRWSAAAAALRAEFRARGEAIVSRALRLSEFAGDVPADRALVTLASALYLLTRSALFAADPVAAARVLKGALTAAQRAGQLLDPALVRAELPLTEEDRLWLARKAEVWLTELAAAGACDAAEHLALGAAFRRLLDPVWFSAGGRFLPDRAWLEAVITDRHMGAAEDAIRLYRACLAALPVEALRADEARARLMELLANVEAPHLHVPRYDEALALAESPRPRDVACARRLEAALRAIERRRPAAPRVPAWASLAMTTGGLTTVLWWGDEPRDVARWQPGDEPDALRRFLKPCQGRLVRAGATLSGLWTEAGPDLAGQPAEPFLEALLEPWLPREGFTPAAVEQIAARSQGAWRAGWDRRTGHPELAPPRAGERAGAGEQALAAALETGLAWLSCLERVRGAEPAVAVGVRRLAQRGDPGALFLARFLDARSAGAGEEAARGSAGDGDGAWPLPPLLARPDPRLAGPSPEVAADPAGLFAERAVLAATGCPGAALRGWAGDGSPWRVVVDGESRLAEVAGAAAAGGGGLTFVPPGGEVHALRPALAWLEARLGARPLDAVAELDLLPLFHWLRLVETHNGDLLDGARLRPRAAGAVPVADRYLAEAAALPRVSPVVNGREEATDPWAREYAARTRRSRVVVGRTAELAADPDRLAALWGADEGGAAVWVFLDSARVHWQLLRDGRQDPRRLHAALARRGRRHLSLVLGGHFLADDLAELLGQWLAAFGPLQVVKPAVAAARDGSAGSSLALACAGVAPDARVLLTAACAGALAHLDRLAQGEPRPVVALPGQGRPAEFWRAFAGGRFGADPSGPVIECVEQHEVWTEGEPPPALAGARLVVPVLASLALEELAPPAADEAVAWAEADQRRSELLARERQICALEVNALLACGAAVVDVADPRWRRRFPLPGVPGPAGLSPERRDDVAAVGAARTEGYDLPVGEGVAGPRPRLLRRRRQDDPRAAVVRAWLRERGWVEPDGTGRPPGCEASPTEDGSADVRLLFTEGRAAWLRWARQLAEARERGEHDAWLLVAGPQPPAGAGRLAAAYPTAAPTVLRSPYPDGASLELSGAPIVWVEPDHLGEAAVREAAAARPPLGAFAADLHLWLPDAVHSRLGAAAALRFLLGELPRVDLLGAGLTRAWRRFFGQKVRGAAGGRGTVVGGSSEAGKASAAEIVVGRLAPLSSRCPDCGGELVLDGPLPFCPACGLDHDSWRGAGLERVARIEALRSKFAGLAARTDLGADGPLQIWLKVEDYQVARSSLIDLGIDCLEAEVGFSARPATGVEWHVLPEDARARRRPAARQALFWPPLSAAELTAVPAPEVRAGMTVWYHRQELQAAALPPAPVTAARCRGLVALASGNGRSPWVRGWGGLLPASAVRALTGLPLAEARAGLALAGWLSVLETGLEPPPPRSSSGARILRTEVPFPELDYRLQRCVDLAARMLPAWLANVPQGSPTLCDLSAPAGAADEEDLAWLDRFLLACSLRLRGGAPGRGDGDMFRGFHGGEELLWVPVDGLLFSTRRRLGCLGMPAALIARLAREADLFRAAAADLLAGAAFGSAARGDGLRVPLSVDLPPAEARLVEMGCLLGVWRLEGTAAVDELDLDGVAWQAGNPPSAWAGSDGLVADLAAERLAWEERLESASRDGLLVTAGADGDATADSGPVRRRSGLTPADGRGGTEAVAPPAEVVRRTTAVLAGSGPALLVLRGSAGTGRLPSIMAAFAAARGTGQLVDNAAVFCPSVASAARFHLTWRRDVDPTLAPAILVAPEGAPAPGVEGPSGLHFPADPGGETAVLLDAEALPREVRFTVAHRYRRGRLLASVDLGAAEEPWEHLFPTTPRDEALVDCLDQREQARRVWDLTRVFAASAAGATGKALKRARSRALRRDRGEVEARWTANLDECLVVLAAEQASGRLGRRVAVVASLREDLVYLGRSLAARGWLPAFQSELDALLLPGALEFVAAVSDVAAGPDSPASELLLPALLGGRDAEAYRRWRAKAGDLAGEPLTDLYARLARLGWAAPLFARPEARRRVDLLVADAGAETPARFVRRPLWEAWRLELANWLDVSSRAPAAPVATLATPETLGATGADTLVYLCLGSEEPARHYRVFARARDRVLVLYQDVSPLPGEEDEVEGD